MLVIWILSLLKEEFFVGVPVESALKPPGIIFMLILYLFHECTCCSLRYILFMIFLLLLFILMAQMLLFKDFHDLLVLVFDRILNFVAEQEVFLFIVAFGTSF